MGIFLFTSFLMMMMMMIFKNERYLMIRQVCVTNSSVAITRKHNVYELRYMTLENKSSKTI